MMNNKPALQLLIQSKTCLISAAGELLSVIKSSRHIAFQTLVSCS